MGVNRLATTAAALPSFPAGSFDYGSAFGVNPWSSAVQRLSQAIADMGTLRGTSQVSRVARPEDPEVEAYMSQVLGSQRNALDEYVRRAAGAGVSRSGLNVRGGPALASSLHHMAMSNLAGGYADRFREAMNYNKYLKSTQYSQYQDAVRNLQNLLGTQHRYLSSEADWQSRLANLAHQDWQDEQEWNRQAPLRELELQRLKQQAAMESWRNSMEQTDRQAAIAKQLELENRWRAALGRSSSTTGTSMSPADLLDAERALVELGLWKPLERKITMRR